MYKSKLNAQKSIEANSHWFDLVLGKIHSYNKKISGILMDFNNFFTMTVQKKSN